MINYASENKIKLLIKLINHPDTFESTPFLQAVLDNDNDKIKLLIN